jgi:molybdenum cofactor biosynthesis enzyme
MVDVSGKPVTAREAEAAATVTVSPQAFAAIKDNRLAKGDVLAVARLAGIQARAGEPQEAVKTLRRLLAIPAGASVSLNRLRIDPVWDPIRNEPGFQELLAGQEHVGP